MTEVNENLPEAHATPKLKPGTETIDDNAVGVPQVREIVGSDVLERILRGNWMGGMAVGWCVVVTGEAALSGGLGVLRHVGPEDSWWAAWSGSSTRFRSASGMTGRS